MVLKPVDEGQATAVLCSGGLDSLVLLAREAARPPVLPVYIRVGLAWEAAEQAALARVLAAPAFAPRVEPLVDLDLPMDDVYPASHWALRGVPPAYDTPDEDVYLVGRNVTLLAKAAVLCAQRGIGRLVLGPLAGNPFPDATPEFFAVMGCALSLGLAHRITVEAPLVSCRKADVIREGLALGVPLALTLSCMNPQDEAHCGRCSKCRERCEAFLEAGVRDETRYAARVND